MKNKYNIGDIVYHNSPDGPQGLIVDWKFQAYTGLYSYLVGWNEKESNWYVDIELSITKVFS
ncbi:hypothetical protein LCGC14_2257110 [marine sediment metagenome]|uniref:Uncharacterized protein n=1 Tax=marine sediment metagenome TaxID=412755 RepID=A0A0F9DNB9_9ZZZZ